MTEIYKWVIFCIGIISLIMSLLVIFAYYKFRRIQSFAFKLIMMLCIADSLNSIGYMFVVGDVQNNYTVCQIQAFFIQFTNISSFILTSLIAYTVLMTCVYSQENPDKNIVYYILIGFIFPGIIAIIPAIAEKYSLEASFYCWLDQNNYTYYVIFGISFFFGILWISIIFFIFCLFRVYRYLNFVGLERSAAQFYKKLLNFPIIMMVCWLPATINRIVMWFKDEQEPEEWLYFMHICFDMLASMLNVCIYGFNEQVRKEFRRFVFSRQGVEDFRDLDEKDNRKKLLENPALQKINFESHHLSPENQLGSPSDIAFFMNEDDKDLGYQRQHHNRQQNFKEINYSQNTDES